MIPYTPGQTITEFFILRKKELRKKRNSDEFYLSVELTNEKGRIFGSFWTEPEKKYAELSEGEPVKVQASVIDWKDGVHLSVNKIRPAQESDCIDPERFLPIAPVNEEDIKKDIFTMIDNVENLHFKGLLNKLYKHEGFWENFARTPGGKLWHHCYKLGLAEHTLSVAKVVLHLTDVYPSLNRDLLITGALVHDIGKIEEYQTKGYIEFTDKGRLHGHITLGFHKIASMIEACDDFPKELGAQLLHLILSHQGALENGSPVVPMTREAFVLYYADEIDSKLNAIDRITKRDRESDRKWSQYINLLNRFIYFGDRAGDDSEIS
jgi:3'-5' exoribonuclease